MDKVKLSSLVFIGFRGLLSFFLYRLIKVVESLARAIIYNISSGLIQYYSSILAKAIIIRGFSV